MVKNLNISWYFTQCLEKVQGQHDSLEKLINGPAQLRPFIDSVKSRAKDVLRDTIGALLYLIEDTSNCIINYVLQANLGSYNNWHTGSPPRHPDHVHARRQSVIPSQ